MLRAAAVILEADDHGIGLWPCMPVLLAHVLRQTDNYLLRTEGHCPTRHDSRKRERGILQEESIS